MFARFSFPAPGRGQRARWRRPGRARRLVLEPLERRSLLAVITVTRFDDAVGTGDGVTLREAILAANTNAAVDGSASGEPAPAVDEIVFAEEAAGQTIVLSEGELFVTDSVKIRGPGPDKLAVSGGSGATQSRVFYFESDSGVSPRSFTLSGLTVRDGNGVGVDSGAGGGVYQKRGHLTILNSVIRDNASLAGLRLGGGLASVSSTLEIVNSTFANNTATFGGAMNVQVTNTSLTNVTISGNSAATNGGGIAQINASGPSSQLRLINCTVTANRAPQGAGIRSSTVGSGREATLSIGNSIVAGNLGGSQFAVNGEGSIVASLGHNLVSDSSGGLTEPSDLQGVNPQLGPLADLGGGMLGHVPRFGEVLNGGNPLLVPADAWDFDGDSNTTEPLPFDQRGVRRQLGPSVDLGAVEKTLLLHNERQPLDVGSANFPALPDGLVSAVDALIIVNHINAFGQGAVAETQPPSSPEWYYDTTGDDLITAADVIAVINFIIAFGSGVPAPQAEPAEAESMGMESIGTASMGNESMGVASSLSNDLESLLAIDTAAQRKSRRR